MEVQVLSPQDFIRRCRQCGCGGTPGWSNMVGGWLADGFARQAEVEPDEKAGKRGGTCGLQHLVKQPTNAEKSGEAWTSAAKAPAAPAPAEARNKIVLRPHKGLAVRDLLGYELSTSVIDACHRHFDGGTFMLRVHPGSNIIILATPHEHVAEALREITRLTIRGRAHSFNSYAADPEGVLRGIVLGIPPGTSQAELRG
ncbi:hypothetical protein HPB52_000954 [Rhipicephalus sanguineus]|uniref:Uncharacterized protein n=1 Tax=Rhipicephalus sanguineus TaxID=34632 RepID=A0A9D4PGI2_RHISA|nr:hypothetical protein HPB52_000954 [Rhipicephalus sanguineus]